MLSCLWDDAYKNNPCCYSKRVAYVAAAGFLSRYLSGPLPYVRRRITVNKMCWVRRKIKHFLSFPNSRLFIFITVFNAQVNTSILLLYTFHRLRYLHTYYHTHTHTHTHTRLLKLGETSITVYQAWRNKWIFWEGDDRSYKCIHCYPPLNDSQHERAWLYKNVHHDNWW